MIDKLNALLADMQVSMDVSTCEEDSYNRVFGRVVEVMDSGGQDNKEDFVLISVAESKYWDEAVNLKLQKLLHMIEYYAARDELPLKVKGAYNAYVKARKGKLKS
jgi:hypothetical protein